MPPILTEPTLATAVTELTARDKDLAGVVDRFGPPPLWARPPGFETLTHIILEQQVSLASAQAARDRLVAATDPLTPTAFLRLDDEQLLAIGFSRQKARYVRLLAARLVDGSLDLDALDALDDDAARATLLELTGVGAWTADVYLLMVLRRPDIWPVGDVALQTAAVNGQGPADAARCHRDGDARRAVASVAGGRRAFALARLPGTPRPILNSGGRRRRRPGARSSLDVP